MCSLVTCNNWPSVISNHRKLTCIKWFCSFKFVMLARLLLREHFHILGPYFLPHTNTVILLDSYCGIVKETGLFSPGFPNYLESVRVNIGFPMVRTDGRSFSRCTVNWLQNFLGWVRFTYPWCSAGAPESSAIIKVNYLIHWTNENRLT